MYLYINQGIDVQCFDILKMMKTRKMKAVEKFKSFSDLKNAEQISEDTSRTDEIQQLLELMRQGEIPVQQKTDKNGK